MLILKSCEAYGRFALHKEASKDGPPHFSTQMRTLLEWTTDKVIPLLIKQQGSTGAATPFGELNISSISAASASPVQPASPSLVVNAPTATRLLSGMAVLFLPAMRSTLPLQTTPMLFFLMGLLYLFYSHRVPSSQNGLPWEDQDLMSLPSRFASGARSLPPQQTRRSSKSSFSLPLPVS